MRNKSGAHPQNMPRGSVDAATLPQYPRISRLGNVVDLAPRAGKMGFTFRGYVRN